MESRRNIRLVCEHCAKKPNPAFIAIEPEWFVGKYVKLGFKAEDGRVEHMWVIVQETSDKEGEELVGELNNDPVLVTDWKCGDHLAFSRAEIEEVLNNE